MQALSDTVDENSRRRELFRVVFRFDANVFLLPGIDNSEKNRSNVRALPNSMPCIFGGSMGTENFDPLPTPLGSDKSARLAYSLKEAADLLGVDYFSVYRLIQRGKIRACRALRGKLLVPRSELLRLLKS